MPISTRLRISLLVWFAMLGLDFLLNGAVFAPIYQAGTGFMLPPSEAFRRIPLGYLAFLILAFAIVELARRLAVRGFAAGMRIGLVVGAVTGVVWSLSLYSIATLGESAALAFGVVWLALVTLGFALAAASLGRAGLRGLVGWVAGFDVVCVVTVVALQSAGVVPTVRP